MCLRKTSTNIFACCLLSSQDCIPQLYQIYLNMEFRWKAIVWPLDIGFSTSLLIPLLYQNGATPVALWHLRSTYFRKRFRLRSLVSWHFQFILYHLFRQREAAHNRTFNLLFIKSMFLTLSVGILRHTYVVLARS